MKKSSFISFIFIILYTPLLSNILKDLKFEKDSTDFLRHYRVKFKENKGQLLDAGGNSIPSVLFKAEAPGVNIFITDKGLTLQTFIIRREPVNDTGKEITGKKKTRFFFDWERIDIELKGADIQKRNINKYGESSTEYNFFNTHYPDGISGVKEYDTIIIKDVYPGIDWVFYNSNEQGFKYDFIVSQGVDYKKIELLYKTKTPIKINDNGELELYTIYGDIKENTPVSYLDKSIIPTQFEMNYQKSSTFNDNKGYETSISFNLLSNFNNLSGSLTIDPQLVWGTMFGGNALDGFMSLDTDVDGNVFVTGYTSSLNFPIQNSGTFFQGTLEGNTDAFVLKFSNSGNLIWATYYGAIGTDKGFSITCDLNGNVFLTGATTSANFPVQNSGTFFQGTIGGDTDVFILKFDNSGNRLWATYYGGSDSEEANSITCDPDGNVFITGYTSSLNFPVQNAGTFFQGTSGGGFNDVFILKFDNSGNRLWATYYGGSTGDRGHSVTCDPDGNLFITGATNSVNFPLQDVGTFFQDTYSGSNDGFVMKFDNSGNRLWATYYGADGDDQGSTIISDLNGGIFLTGYTGSSNFPVQDAGTFFQGIHGGGNYDLFISKFDNSGNQLWATYYGGNDNELHYEYDNLAVDSYGNLYVGCRTQSSDIFTLDVGCGSYFDGIYGGMDDCFITKFTNDGVLQWASFIGGEGSDFRTPLAVDDSDNLFMGGEFTNYSSTSNLPILDYGGGAYFDDIPNGDDDSYLLKFTPVTASFVSFSQSQVNVSECNICNGSASVTLTGCFSSSLSYRWSNGSQTLNTEDTTNAIFGLCAGNYWVEIKSDSILLDTLFFTITNMGTTANIFVPTIFSPNGDELNDEFCIYGNCKIIDFELRVYNRWGEMIFISMSQDECWDGYYDGDIVNTGVFVYKLKATLVNGEIVNQSGNLTVVN